MRNIYDMILYQDRLKKKKKGKFNRITFNSIVKNKIYFLISVYKIYWNDFITISFFFYDRRGVRVSIDESVHLSRSGRKQFRTSSIYVFHWTVCYWNCV